MQYLKEELTDYRNSDVYPFHMPGHKRQTEGLFESYGIDITEIDGFDNLHHAEGILKEAQERAAELYHSKSCFYLVNGSTCGLLAAICAATCKRDRVLVARNSHKAVYHALFLNELHAQYLYPEITKTGIQGQITKEQVKEVLSQNTDIEAVIITSPTYEGIVSDIKGIAQIVHERGIPLIVDSAHGAHFGFGHGTPESAVTQGADAVIMSLHKTLPSFTQTALLHICSDRISEEKVKKYLSIFETSSPSYVFMAGMDHCIRLLAEQGNSLFFRWRELLKNFYQSVSDLKYLHVMTAEDLEKRDAYDWDDSKLVIFCEKAGMSGQKLHEILLQQYHLQMEMVSGDYVLGMTSIMDSPEGFNRLALALHEIDQKVEKIVGNVDKIGTNDTYCGKESHFLGEKSTKKADRSFIERMYRRNPQEMQIYQAGQLPEKEVSFAEAEGQMCAETIFLYPPGIPLIIPGEIITEEFLQRICECIELGLRVEGSADLTEKRIKIVYF